MLPEEDRHWEEKRAEPTRKAGARGRDDYWLGLGRRYPRKTEREGPVGPPGRLGYSFWNWWRAARQLVRGRGGARGGRRGVSRYGEIHAMLACLCLVVPCRCGLGGPCEWVLCVVVVVVPSERSSSTCEICILVSEIVKEDGAPAWLERRGRRLSRRGLL